MRSSSRLFPAVLLVTACAFWGAATVLNKALLPSIPPISLLVLQLAPSTLVLWAIVIANGTTPPSRHVLFQVILLGILNPGISYTLSLMGLARTTASVATLLWAAEPLMIACLAALVLRESITKRLLAIILTGGFGVLLVAGVLNDVGRSGWELTGNALLLAAVLCCAIYTVVAKKISPDVDPLFAIATQQAAGLCWASVLLLAETPYGTPHDLSSVPIGLMAAAAVSGLLYYAAAYWLYLVALRFVTAGIAGSYFNVIPIFGVGFAMVFLGEMLQPIQWVGAVIILLSALELMRATGRREASG